MNPWRPLDTTGLCWVKFFYINFLFAVFLGDPGEARGCSTTNIVISVWSSLSGGLVRTPTWRDFNTEYTSEAEVLLKIFGPKILSFYKNCGEVKFNPKFATRHKVLLSTRWRGEVFLKFSSPPKNVLLSTKKSSPLQFITIEPHFLPFQFHKELYLFQIKLDLFKIELHLSKIQLYLSK